MTWNMDTFSESGVVMDLNQIKFSYHLKIIVMINTLSNQDQILAINSSLNFFL
jgi:hypothetical protein